MYSLGVQRVLHADLLQQRGVPVEPLAQRPEPRGAELDRTEAQAAGTARTRRPSRRQVMNTSAARCATTMKYGPDALLASGTVGEHRVQRRRVGPPTRAGTSGRRPRRLASPPAPMCRNTGVSDSSSSRQKSSHTGAAGDVPAGGSAHGNSTPRAPLSTTRCSSANAASCSLMLIWQTARARSSARRVQSMT